jgi:hypothetical protein
MNVDGAPAEQMQMNVEFGLKAMENLRSSAFICG